jgi:hypothetical protein
MPGAESIAASDLWGLTHLAARAVEAYISMIEVRCSGEKIKNALVHSPDRGVRFEDGEI